MEETNMGSQRKLNDTHLSHKQINIPFTGALKVKVGSTFWSTLAISTCLGIHGTSTEDLDRRKLEVKLPTIWTDGIAEGGRVREEKSRREKIREEKE